MVALIGNPAKTLVIGKAEKSDIARLLDVYQYLNPEDRGPDEDEARLILDRLMAYDGSAIFIGKIGASIVVSCTLIVIPNLTRGGRPYALIENVVTHADYRQQGFAKRILSVAIEDAREAGCYKVMLLTGRDPDVCNFYLKAGFEQSKTGFQIRLTETPQ